MRGLDLLGSSQVSDDQRQQAEALNKQGEDSLEEGFYRLAELRFLEAFELDRANPLYELNLARAILANPKRAPAVRSRMARVHLELAAKRNPDDADTRYYLARCQSEGGDALNAKRNLEHAIRLNGGVFPEAQRLLSRLGGDASDQAAPTRRRGLFGWLRLSS